MLSYRRAARPDAAGLLGVDGGEELPVGALNPKTSGIASTENFWGRLASAVFQAMQPPRRINRRSNSGEVSRTLLVPAGNRVGMGKCTCRRIGPLLKLPRKLDALDIRATLWRKVPRYS